MTYCAATEQGEPMEVYLADLLLSTPFDCTIPRGVFMVSLSLFRNAETREFAPGETIFSAGDEGKVMYVVTEGEVDIRVGQVIVETVTPGGIFGEMALIDHHVRSADAISRTKCCLVEVDQRRFQFLISETPYFSLQVMSIMAERLRHANEAMKKGMPA
jgi:CRP/FNR family cyclic AMP-dependent transcriptional regulator